MDRLQHVIAERAAARAILGAPVLACIALMVLNDHLLKGGGVLPGVVTGKLSDLAFLFFAPIVLAFVLRARTLPALLGCYGAPTALFVIINLSPFASELFAAAMSRLLPMQLWPDPSDLLALTVLPLSWHELTRARRERQPRQARLSHTLVTAIAAIGCMATSPPRVPVMPTHEPVYMGWKEFRSTAVQVHGPRDIGKRGKLLIVDDYLFISEPGEGVHVFDNRDREHPVALLFIRIPGNIDIAVKGNLLYADTFVDLLTFELDLEHRVVRLIGRLEDQFNYDPYQTLEAEERIWFQADESRGVVVGLRPIDQAAQEQRDE